MSTKLPHQLAIGVYGKIKLSLDPNDPNPREYIYQRVRKGKGGIESPGRYDMQLRRKGERIDNPSLTQLQGRARMRAATAAWQVLDPAEQDALRRRADALNLSGFNLFVREFCATHPREGY